MTTASRSTIRSGRRGVDRPCKKGIKRFFADAGLCPRLTPSSHCLFVRSPVVGSIPTATRPSLKDACWPFYDAIIEQIEVKAILCMGGDAYEAVRRRFRVTKQVDELPDGWYPPRSALSGCNRERDAHLQAHPPEPRTLAVRTEQPGTARAPRAGTPSLTPKTPT